MSRDYSWAAEKYEDELIGGLSYDRLQEIIGAATVGRSEDDGAELIWNAREDGRGDLTLALYYRYRNDEVKQAVFRGALEAAWVDNHHYIVRATRKNRLLLKALFKRAGFAPPETSLSVIDIWRGTYGATVGEARRGISWTMDRDVACWYAYRFSDENRRPLLLKASVSAGDLIALKNVRQESEVIYFGDQGAVDGIEEDWLEARMWHALLIGKNDKKFFQVLLDQFAVRSVSTAAETPSAYDD